MKAIHLVIHGRVQGVFFRKYTKQKAQSLKLKGTVKNLQNGSVDIIAQGDEDRLRIFIEWCHQGSPTSKVENVEMSHTAIGDYTDFEIVR